MQAEASTDQDATPDITGRVSIRSAWDTDLPYVYSSWLKSFRTAPKHKRGPKRLYFGHYHPLVMDLVARESTELRIACDRRDPNFIVGYICWSPMAVPVLHWLSVKHTFRGLGVARMLAESIGVGPESAIAYTFEGRLAPKLKRQVKAAEHVAVEDFLA